MVKSFQSRYTKLQGWIDQAYMDKLDGKISEEFWRQKTDEWRLEQERVRTKIQAHEAANTNYLTEGVKILELANQAYYQYFRQSSQDKARLLRIVLSNCSLKDGTPYPTYRKPFDLLANGVKTQNWLGLLDDFRTICITPQLISGVNLPEICQLVNLAVAAYLLP